MVQKAELHKHDSRAALRLLTIKDVAERMQVSCRTIHRLVGNGDLKVIHIGRSVRVSEEALKAFLNQGDTA